MDDLNSQLEFEGFEAEVETSIDAPGRKYQIKKIQDNHREILRLAAIGQKPGEIAALMGMTQVQVSNVLYSDIAKAHLGEMHGNRDELFLKTARELEDLLPKATEIFQKILNENVTTTPMQRVRVAESLFDRVGFGKQTKVEQTSTNTSVDLAALAEIREKARARREAENAVVTDVKEGIECTGTG